MLGICKEILQTQASCILLLRCSCPDSCVGRALAVLEGDAGLEEVLLAPLRRMTEMQVRKRLVGRKC